MKKYMFIFCMAAFLGMPLSAESISLQAAPLIVQIGVASFTPAASKGYFRQRLNYVGRKAKELARYFVFERPYVGLAVAAAVFFAYKLNNERLERERLNNERLERERLNNERLNNERLERERLERERLDNELLERHLSKRDKLFGGVLAPDHFQKMGIEAQKNVGIPEDEQGLMVQAPFKPNSFKDIDFTACAGDKAIFLNFVFFRLPYGAQRCVLHHEAVHRKYHDWSNLNKYDKEDEHQSKNDVKMGDEYARFCENRADTEGFHATQCYECILEHVSTMKPNLDEDKSGYLTPDELTKIALDFRQQNKLCESHKKGHFCL